MAFGSFVRIALVGTSLGACVSQYTSPGGEVEHTNTESSSSGSHDESETVEPSTERHDTQDETKSTSSEPESAPSEASGACDDRTCVSTTDCCKGYACGFDPERSKVMRYCLSQQ
jgi:hypothetical protein